MGCMFIKDNIIKDKSYKFALNIIKLYQYLSKDKLEYVLSRQLLRSGTSIGANVEEALAASSRKDFIHKMSIASKEARESIYWIRLLVDSGIISKKQSDRLLKQGNEIVKILTSIVKTSNEKNKKERRSGS